MSDTDLANALRGAGHDDLAESLERKRLASELDALGRPDLAERLTSGTKSLPERAPSAEAQEGRAILETIDRDTTPGSSSPWPKGGSHGA